MIASYEIFIEFSKLRISHIAAPSLYIRQGSNAKGFIWYKIFRKISELVSQTCKKGVPGFAPAHPFIGFLLSPITLHIPQPWFPESR